MNEQTTKYQFKAEIKQLLDILVHSLYTSKDIFLRELISNASDALDKVRLKTLKGEEVADKDLPLEIKITFNEEEKTITISDTGIGMTKEELIENIGTIAKSGSAEFIKQMADNKADASNIIGKFGVGFYSVFMAAKDVVIKTRSYQPEATGWQWKSEGVGDFEITAIEEPLTRGTTIVINLRDTEKDFATKQTLENTIKRYSNFITFPIYLENERVNTVSALWREPKSNIKKEQYDEFFKFVSHSFDEPADVIHNSIDAPIQFNSLLFIPKKSFDFFRMNKEDYGLDLYVRRVLIQHKNKDLLPEYLSFVKGVVDSEDLPLNISRETLQENVVFGKISSTVTSQVLSYLIKKSKDDVEGYNAFWKEHGNIFKLGYSDFLNLDKFNQLLRFNSSANEDEKSLTSLEEYISRMKEGQKEIYYVSGPNRASVELDPHLEFFKNKGIEVLYFFDPIDDFIIAQLRKYKDFDFRSVINANIADLDKFEDVNKAEKPEELTEEQNKDFENLIEKIKEILGDRVTEVKESKRLRSSAVCLINPDDEFTQQMQKILRMSNKDMPAGKKIMEINKDHKLIRNLLKTFKADSSDMFLNNIIEQLYDSALLQEGNLQDPYILVDRMNKYLEQSSEWYIKVKNLD